MPDGSAGAYPTDLIPFVSPHQLPQNVKFTLQELANYLMQGGVQIAQALASGLSLTNGNPGNQFQIYSPFNGAWNFSTTSNSGVIYCGGGPAYVAIDMGGGTVGIFDNGGDSIILDGTGNIALTCSTFLLQDGGGSSIGLDGAGHMTLLGDSIDIKSSSSGQLAMNADGTVSLSSTGGQSINFDVTGGTQFTASSLFNFSGAPCLFQSGVQTIEGDTFYAHTVAGNLVWTTSP